MNISRRHVIGSALALTSARAVSAAPPARKTTGLLLAKDDRLLMVGDSVTDAGRKDPGEGLFDAVGKGYVALVDGLLGSTYPELGIRVANKGVSGNTTRDLKARWQKDVLDLKPQWVSVMIGINDVWRQFDSPRMKEQHVLLPEYEANLDQLVGKTVGQVKGIVMMTPYYIEPNPQDAMRAAMDRYGAAVKRVAHKHSTLLVDTQAAFDRLMKSTYPATISWDRVHPNHIGQAVLARAFLDAVGFAWR